MRVFLSFVSFLTALFALPAHAQELRIVSRNATVFIDSAHDGEARTEWASYRVGEETRPVIFKVDGPGKFVLKLRTYLETTNREAVSTVLRDDAIVLTARVPAVLDPDVKLVEGGKKRLTKSRTFVVRLDAGAHTVTVRHSDGPALLVLASFAPGLSSDGINGEVATSDPRADGDRFEDGARASTVAARGEGVEELVSNSGVIDPSADEAMKTNSATPERPLTQRAAFVTIEPRGGVVISRLGLNLGPVAGFDVRFPVPMLDARRFSIGLALDAKYGSGQAPVISASTGAAVDVAKLKRLGFDAAVDVRWVVARLADVLEPYVAAGGGVTIGALTTETGAGKTEETRVEPIGVLRIGAAFGDIGGRPFIEATGALAPKDTTFKATVGYRFEILGDVPVN